MLLTQNSAQRIIKDTRFIGLFILEYEVLVNICSRMEFEPVTFNGNLRILNINIPRRLRCCNTITYANNITFVSPCFPHDVFFKLGKLGTVPVIHVGFCAIPTRERMHSRRKILARFIKVLVKGFYSSSSPFDGGVTWITGTVPSFCACFLFGLQDSPISFVYLNHRSWSFSAL